ncbi:MAG: polypeptide N-acetylgalactosaminyltransferase 10 [Verrucomicrobiota bacterium]
MKTEIIIACRGEIPANLERTVTAALAESPVCVVYDGMESPRFGEKPHRLAARPGLRILESRWREPRGCGQARHYGITTSAADTVIITDGHMTFPAGWVQRIAHHLAKHRKDVTCCSTQSLSANWAPLAGEVYHGAYLAINTVEPQVDISGPHVEYFGIAAKWESGPEPESRTIQAPMGACYGMRREWYKAMGEPFEILEAWGGEEELLALCGYLCGGRTYLMPLTCGHVHAAPHQGRVIHPAGRWANRLAILWAMPDMEAAREIENHMRQTALKWSVIEGLITDERGERIERLRKHLASQPRKWAKACAALVRPRKDFRLTAQTQEPRRIPPAPLSDKTQVVHRPAEVCARCHSVNPFRKIGGPRRYAAFRVSPARCWRCGHKAQIRTPAV